MSHIKLNQYKYIKCSTNSIPSLPSKKALILIISAMSALFTLSGGCNRNNAEKQPARRNPVLVKIVPVQQGPLVQTLNYKGTVFPWKRANIGPDTSGRVHRIYKKAGDRVKKGQLLAELDTTSLKLQLKQARAAVEIANAAYKDAKLNHQRLKKLYKKTAISKIQLEKSTLSLESAETQRKNAQATVDLIRHSLKNAIMHAPFGGIITSKNAEEGDVINPMMGMGASVLTLMNLETIKVVLQIPSEEIEKIAVGQPCTVKVTTLPNETFTGVVYTKNLAADPVSKTFKVEIKVDNPQLKIKSGIFAEAAIEIARKDHRLLLPLSALNRDGKRTYVVLYREGKAKFKTISIGAQNDRLFEVENGLSKGQLVVVEGNYDLKDGAPITDQESPGNIGSKTNPGGKKNENR
jgi:RND family efflux transporter MFP subunit